MPVDNGCWGWLGCIFRGRITCSDFIRHIGNSAYATVEALVEVTSSANEDLTPEAELYAANDTTEFPIFS
ncbi:MAG: hypothetical protein J4O09_14475 [Chloroflexi bacterium]|nr:hypothetical protein [Chloroflexota bacterium]